MPFISASSGLSKSFADANASTPVLGLSVNLPPSAPPAVPDGIDQRRLAADVTSSVAVSLATAVWFSAAAKLVDPVTSGAGWGPSTLMLAGADSRRPSSVHGAASGLQARFAGSVMTTSASPLGVTSIRQPTLLPDISRPWPVTIPPVIVNSL